MDNTVSKILFYDALFVIKLISGDLYRHLVHDINT